MAEDEKPKGMGEEEIAERLKPGLVSPPESDPKEWQQTGRCDGVIFLDEACTVISDQDGVIIKEVHEESLLRKALSYLRPTSEKYLKRNPGIKGRGHPMFPTFMLPAELMKQADEERRGVYWLFIADTPQGSSAQAPEYRRKWVLRKCEEGIWGVIFDGSR